VSEPPGTLQTLPDLTTRSSGIEPGAEVLVWQPPAVRREVPGALWQGQIGEAEAVVRLPVDWNGKLMVGGVPAVRGARSLDQVLSDIALQRGYAYAACDKATPGLTLRDSGRSAAEWVPAYAALITWARRLLTSHYGAPPRLTYAAGVSNGGYVVRALLERHPDLVDGGVDWEGTLFNPDGPHPLAYLPEWLTDYPPYRRALAAGNATEASRSRERLLQAGLPDAAEGAWDVYFRRYWVVTLWLYGRNFDPGWPSFAAPWDDTWIADPSPLLNGYRFADRRAVVDPRLQPLALSGRLARPLLTVAGDADCLLPFPYQAARYAALVAQAGSGDRHRLYAVVGGNHADGLLREAGSGQQPVLPYFEAALYLLEDWVERHQLPPPSGKVRRVEDLAGGRDLLTPHGGGGSEHEPG
jgi:pimeloyl-ACP methyl ester carboxylesterase